MPNMSPFGASHMPTTSSQCKKDKADQAKHKKNAPQKAFSLDGQSKQHKLTTLPKQYFITQDELNSFTCLLECGVFLPLRNLAKAPWRANGAPWLGKHSRMRGVNELHDGTNVLAKTLRCHTNGIFARVHFA